MSRTKGIICNTLFVALALSFFSLRSAWAEDAANGNNNNNNNANYNYNNGYYNNGQNYYGNDGYYNYQNNNMYGNGNGDDDAAQAYYDEAQAYADDGNNNGYNNNQDDDGITYWTEYAIYPKRCIVYNDVDVIIYNMYDAAYNHCSDDPVGTYTSPVPMFVQGYLQQQAQDMEDQGYDYEEPEVAQYAYCVPYETANQILYFQLGCSDVSNQELAVNIYQDNECTIRSQVDGFDDANIDVSAIALPFQKCEACVNWFDMEEQADDQYYEVHQTQAPFCSTAWSYRQACGRKCRHTGEAKERVGWNTSDKVLLAILGLFALLMVGLIVRKRQKMSNKDALLEQAAISAAGLQQPHVIGICTLVILVIAVFALLGLKNITWALLLLINTALFGYLMKLTVDSGVSAGENIVGPDGTILRQDSDESSTMEPPTPSSQARGGFGGIFTLPTIT